MKNENVFGVPMKIRSVIHTEYPTAIIIIITTAWWPIWFIRKGVAINASFDYAPKSKGFNIMYAIKICNHLCVCVYVCIYSSPLKHAVFFLVNISGNQTFGFNLDFSLVSLFF